MKYLLAGKNGVLDTMLVAAGFMGLNDTNNCRDFANLELEKKGQIIRVGYDGKGNEIYAAGNKHPEIVETIADQLWELSQQKSAERPLTLILVSVPGENLTAWMVTLAGLPLIGTWFARLAHNYTLQRKNQLIRKGKVLRIEQDTGLQPHPVLVAAKPFKP